jgi:hypothetical protein
MPRTVSCVEFSPRDQVAAVRLARRQDDLDIDTDYYRRSIGRHAASEHSPIGMLAHSAAMFHKAQAASYANLRALGGLLVDAGLEPGDEAIVHGERFGLKRLGWTTRFVGGRVEEVESFVAVPLGPADPPSDDDIDASGLLAEDRSEYHRVTFAG